MDNRLEKKYKKIMISNFIGLFVVIVILAVILLFQYLFLS